MRILRMEKEKGEKIPKLIIAMVSPAHQIFNILKRGFYSEKHTLKSYNLRQGWKIFRNIFIDFFIFQFKKFISNKTFKF